MSIELVKESNMDNLRKGIEELLKQTKVEEVDDGKEKEVEEEKVEEEVKEEKPVYEEELGKLAKDEEEAIDGYKAAIEKLGDDKVVEQLKKVLAEEEKHLEFLKRAMTDHDARYEEE